MVKDLYSIIEVAELLGLHVKTVRNYVHEGRLKHTRVGKQYRIARADLDAFTGGALTSGQPVHVPVETAVSSVVELNGINSERAQRISSMVTVVGKGRNDSQAMQIQAVHDPSRARLKLIIVGSLDTTRAMLGMLEHLLQGSAAAA